jgi:serine protease Do
MPTMCSNVGWVTRYPRVQTTSHPFSLTMACDRLKRETMTYSTPARAKLALAFLIALACPPLLAAEAAAPVMATPVAGLPDFADLVEKAGPAVVNIRTTERVRTQSGTPTEEEMQEFLRRFFGGQLPRQPNPAPGPRNRRQAPQEEDVQRGVGSGFIISNDGYVLTNAHVVDGADDVLVTLLDRRELKAKVIGADKRSDVALLKVEGKDLPHLRIGDSSKIRVGEWVIAIGSPFNLENTVTAGIISAKARDTGDFLPLIQSDVAVNPGNSGGPLINLRGEVIGINSQIATLSGGYNGISFAVPIDEVMRVTDQLKKTGKVTRGRLGVQIGEVSKEVAEALGLGRARGVEVSKVDPDGPAAKAGIEAGDIILKFNGAPIERSTDLPRLVGGAQVGSRATVTLWRKGAQLEVPVTVVELPDDSLPARKPTPKKPKPEQAANELGLHVSDLTESQRKQLKVAGGVVIDASEGAAARSGLRPGDVILRVDNVDVRDAKSFNAQTAKLDPKKSVVLLVWREEATHHVFLRPRQ